MKLTFSIQEVIGMLVRYFKDFEDREVRVTASLGKVVNQPKYMPPLNVMNFDVYERVNDEQGRTVEKKRLLDDGLLERAVSLVVAEAGFEVSGIEYTSEGIVVQGDKNVSKEKQM